jgi:tRNA A37 threonylcarbamoyladenosine synthetase subunit TsaC/SUA5/YrdC
MTVAELIAELKKQPQDAEVRCFGPDSEGWGEYILSNAVKTELITDQNINIGDYIQEWLPTREEIAEEKEKKAYWTGPYVLIVPEEDK